MADISKIQLPGGSIYNIKDEVARQAASEGVNIVVVNELPTASAETMGSIYLVPAPTTKDKNVKNEFVTWQPTGSTYAWEQIGSTSIDLSNYAQYGNGVTVTLSSLPVSGTGVSAHSVTDAGHGHTISGTTTADGENAASSVSFGASSVTASKVNTAGSVSAGTANTPTVIDTTKFSGGSLSAGSFDGGSGSFTQGTFSQGTLPELTTTVTGETLTLGWSAGTLPTHGEDVHVHNEATHTQGTLTPAAFQAGFYTAGTAGTPTSVTLPTFDTVSNLVDTANVATAAAQVFTGKSSEVTGTAANATTGISIANHSVTQGTVSGNASGTINTPTSA